MHVPPSAVEAHHPWPSIFIVCDIRPEGSIDTISATMIILQHVSISQSVYCLQFLQNHIIRSLQSKLSEVSADQCKEHLSRWPLI